MGNKSRVPSPCIDVCKFRRAGHCIGCSMTRTQKKMFKALKRPEHRIAFVEMLVHQQDALGGFGHWRVAYARKCARKGRQPPVSVASETG